MLIQFELKVECSCCHAIDEVERVVMDDHQLIICKKCKHESEKFDVFLRTERFASIKCLCEVGRSRQCIF